MHMSPYNRHILAFTPLAQASALQTAVNKYMFPLYSLTRFLFSFLQYWGLNPGLCTNYSSIVPWNNIYSTLQYFQCTKVLRIHSHMKGLCILLMDREY